MVGTGASLVVNGNTLFGATSNSSINGTDGNFSLTLNSGNTLTGITIGSGTGTNVGGITGTNFGTLTVGTSVAIDASGQALSLNTGTVANAATGFSSTNSDAGTNNISLTNISGTVALGNLGTLSGATANAINIVNTSATGERRRPDLWRHRHPDRHGRPAQRRRRRSGHTGTITPDRHQERERRAPA